MDSIYIAWTLIKIYGGGFGPFGNGFRVIKPGDRGSDVYEIQKRLKTAEYYHGYVNGIYGEGMKSAILSFEKKNGLQQTNYIGRNFYNKLGVFIFD